MISLGNHMGTCSGIGKAYYLLVECTYRSLCMEVIACNNYCMNQVFSQQEKLNKFAIVKTLLHTYAKKLMDEMLYILEQISYRTSKLSSWKSELLILLPYRYFLNIIIGIKISFKCFLFIHLAYLLSIGLKRKQRTF
jgi:hypothetical protein